MFRKATSQRLKKMTTFPFKCKSSKEGKDWEEPESITEEEKSAWPVQSGNSKKK